jgi:hypothetical protein
MRGVGGFLSHQKEIVGPKEKSSEFFLDQDPLLIRVSWAIILSGNEAFGGFQVSRRGPQIR